MVYRGLPFMSESEKGIERDLILRGGPRSPDDRARILDYCERDVQATAQLFEVLRPAIDLERARVRGWYTKSVARIEHTGIPLDVPMFDHLRANLDQLSQEFISVSTRQSMFMKVPISGRFDSSIGSTAAVTGGRGPRPEAGPR